MRPFLSRSMMQLLTAFLVVGLANQVYSEEEASIEDVVENYETGEKKAEYQTENGKRSGTYTEFYLGGQTRVEAYYREGQLNGKYTSFHGNGKRHVELRYKRGLRQGQFTEKDEKGELLASGRYVVDKLDGVVNTYTKGRPDDRNECDEGVLTMFRGKKTYPRSIKEMANELRGIAKARLPFKTATPAQVSAIRRLNGHRYLSGVSAKVKLDEDLCEMARDEVEELSFAAPEKVETNNSVRIPDNVESPSLFAGVDAFMADMVESQRQGLARRRQLLNPRMNRVGLGLKNRFMVMTANEFKPRKAPNWHLVSHPAHGYMPVDYFSADRPWMLIINHKHYRSVINEKSMVVRPIEENLRLGKPLELENKTQFLLNVLDKDAPADHVFYFYPQNLDISPGKRYWIQITGFLKRGGGSDHSIEYVVEFTKPIDLTTKSKKGKKKRSTRKKG